MTYEEFLSLCNNRRSIRYFDDEPLSTHDVMKLLELARLAPSVENLQPWHFHVVFESELKRQLMEASCYGNFVEGASTFIVITVDKSLEQQVNPVWNPRELEYSCMAAAEHILLGATAMGLGSCWVSLHHGKAHDVLELPRHKAVVGGIMIGRYRSGEETGSNGHQRRPMKDIVTFYE